VRTEEKALLSLFGEEGQGGLAPFPGGQKKAFKSGPYPPLLPGRRGVGLLPQAPKARRGPPPSGGLTKTPLSSGVGQSRRNEMDRPGEGPRVLGRRSSRLGNGDLPHKPPIPDTPGPKIHLGRTLEGEEFAPGGRALEKT